MDPPVEEAEEIPKEKKKIVLRKTHQYDPALFLSADEPHATNILDYLSGGVLITCGNVINPYHAFIGKKIIAYYFSASWVPHCRQILPKLKQVYQKGLDIKASFEVIYISSDTDEQTMVRYFQKRHHVWYAVPLNDPACEIMRQFYQVTHIPTIIIVNSKGQIISREGVKDIYELGFNVFLAWNSDPV